MSRIVTTWMLSEPERPVVRRALRLSRSRGRVEYDPTHVVAALAVLTDRDAVPLSAAAVHAVDDVLRWANSATQARRWTAEDLRTLQRVRARLESHEEPSREVEEVQTLW
jgi:hypothetical protein